MKNKDIISKGLIEGKVIGKTNGSYKWVNWRCSVCKNYNYVTIGCLCSHLQEKHGYKKFIIDLEKEQILSFKEVIL